MKTSQRGIDLIKNFEGFRAMSYKALPTEKYYTIGYGHYGPDVRFTQCVTKKEAEDMLKADIVRFENAVNKWDGKYHFTQNEFDALVSFTYNLGEGCLNQVTADGTRTKAQIADKMLLYYNAGGKKIEGLVLRRKMERDLFLTTSGSTESIPEAEKYQIAIPTLRARCRGDKVKILQKNCNDFFGSGIQEDGIFGQKTKDAIIFMQSALGCTMDGIYGPITAGKLKDLAIERGYNI